MKCMPSISEYWQLPPPYGEIAQHAASGIVIAFRCDAYKYPLRTGFVLRATLPEDPEDVWKQRGCIFFFRIQCFELNIDIFMRFCVLCRSRSKGCVLAGRDENLLRVCVFFLHGPKHWQTFLSRRLHCRNTWPDIAVCVQNTGSSSSLFPTIFMSHRAHAPSALHYRVWGTFRINFTSKCIHMHT